MKTSLIEAAKRFMKACDGLDEAAYCAAHGELKDAIASQQKHDARMLNSLEQLEAALEKLACLGNGRAWGNSDGNCIAQGALLHLDPLLKLLRNEVYHAVIMVTATPQPLFYIKRNGELKEFYYSDLPVRVEAGDIVQSARCESSIDIG